MEMKIIKQRVDSTSQKLNVKWSFEGFNDIVEQPRKKPETREEEADEIIHRLKTPPRTHRSPIEIKNQIMDILSRQIAKDIDDEILKCLSKK
jgi:hypothetical protein